MTPYFESPVVADGHLAYRRPVVGHLVQVSHNRNEARNMLIEDVPSRALCRYEIHELVVTDDNNLSAGALVSNISYIGFFEVSVGSMARLGDAFEVGGKLLGHLVGFDFCHMPNHLNIIVRAVEDFPRPPTGQELDLRVGGSVRVLPQS